MYCSNCGKTVREDAVFCLQCGSKIESISGNTDIVNQEASNAIINEHQALKKKFPLALVLTSISSIVLLIGLLAVLFMNCNQKNNRSEGNGKNLFYTTKGL